MDSEALKRNLEDCGCDKELISHFCSSEADRKEQLEILSRQRQTLLEKVHDGEQKISNLDYLVFQLEKEAKAQ